MQLTVKNYKRVEWASEETDCFTASLYVDGKRVGTARNDGHGGPDYYEFESREAETRFEAAVAEWVDSVKHEPRWQLDDGRCFADAECCVGEACAAFRREREMKRALKGYEKVVRIERPSGWQTEIITISLPEGFSPSEIIAEKAQNGDTAYIYETGRMTVWNG